MDDFSTDEFIQGFLEESGEHLHSIRSNLAQIDRLIAQAGDLGDAEMTRVLNELFRSFHTIKGLAGMVKLEEAARISHAIETLLQAIRQGQIELTHISFDLLVEGVRSLENSIAFFKNPSSPPPPDFSPVLERIQSLLPSTVPRQSPASDAPEQNRVLAILPDLAAHLAMLQAIGPLEFQEIQRAAWAGLGFSLAYFSPSAEKSAQGINVDQVRYQLSQTAKIIKAVPLMQANSIRFAFLLASQQAPSTEEVQVDEILVLAARAPVAPAAQKTPNRKASRQTPEEHLTSTSIRVELKRLDELVFATGDLMRLQNRLSETLAQLNSAPQAVHRELNSTYQQMNRTLRRLRQSILRARMVPLSEVFHHMPLVVRDLARSHGKEVHLEIAGENTEVDKMLVDGLLDPLLHLVRNAVIHGLEAPAERAAAGKPERGILRISGEPEGDRIHIVISDDGRGVDLPLVQAKAAAQGWVDPGRALNAGQVLDLISRHGFSTRDQADLGAGRGVGLDIVRRAVEAFSGTLEMTTTSGQGTAFHLRLPLTLLMMDVLIVLAGDERFAAPRNMVDEVIEIDPAQVMQLESGEVYPHRGAPVVLHRLSRLIDIPASTHPTPGRCAYALIRRSGNQQEALVIDRVLSMKEVVVQTLTDPLIARPGIGGATDLGDGQVILILDLPALFRMNA